MVWELGRDKVTEMKARIEKLSNQLKNECTTESGIHNSAKLIRIENPTLTTMKNFTCFSMVKQSSLVGFLATKQILSWKNIDKTWRGDPSRVYGSVSSS